MIHSMMSIVNFEVAVGCKGEHLYQIKFSIMPLSEKYRISDNIKRFVMERARNNKRLLTIVQKTQAVKRKIFI